MTSDLLTQFRSDVPLPDDTTAQRIHARATIGPQRTYRRTLVAAVAVTTIGAAIGAAALAGTIGGSAPQSARHPGAPGGDVPRTDALAVNLNRSGGMLNSVDLTVNPGGADSTIWLQVLHTSATTVVPGTNATSTVVFTKRVSATNTPGAASGPSTWSGSLSPTDWSGGCQSGLYDIVVRAAGPGAPLDTPSGSWYHSGWFSCTGN